MTCIAACGESFFFISISQMDYDNPVPRQLRAVQKSGRCFDILFTVAMTTNVQGDLLYRCHGSRLTKADMTCTALAPYKGVNVSEIE